jgi:hypothetical protein
MSSSVLLEIEMPEDWEAFKLPEGVQQRLQTLLDRQDSGTPLTPDERKEAEGLVDLAEWLSLLRLRARRSQAELRSA